MRVIFTEVQEAAMKVMQAAENLHERTSQHGL
jgi:hypothetical protein